MSRSNSEGFLEALLTLLIVFLLLLGASEAIHLALTGIAWLVGWLS